MQMKNEFSSRVTIWKLTKKISLTFPYLIRIQHKRTAESSFY